MQTSLDKEIRREVAEGAVARLRANVGRRVRCANVLRILAPRMESTAGGRRQQARRGSRDRFEAMAGAADSLGSTQQALRARGLSADEHVLPGALLCALPGLHRLDSTF